jgi:hypothetical protein
MKLPTLFAVLALILACLPAQATWTLQAHTGAGSTNGNSVTTTGINTAACSAPCIGFVAIHSYGSFVVPTLTDAVGACGSIGVTSCNTWTQLTSNNGGAGEARDTIWWCFNPTTGASHVFEGNLTSSAPSINTAFFSGALASPFDAQSGGTGSGVTSVQATSAVGVSGELVISSFTGEATGSINDSFTITDSVAFSSGNCFSGGFAYLVTTGAINPTWTWTGSHPASTSLASFKAATGSPTMIPSIL